LKYLYFLNGTTTNEQRQKRIQMTMLAKSIIFLILCIIPFCQDKETAFWMGVLIISVGWVFGNYLDTKDHHQSATGVKQVSPRDLDQMLQKIGEEHDMIHP
tara:strand:- start:4849 stop:5151 length:303 start_codon:yes stop_codon:yes gene_type:complete